MTDIALITGATRGLGRTAARRLAEHGYTVLLGARDLERGRAAAAEIAGGTGDVVPVAIDVTSDASVAEAMATVEREYGRLDVLVNNAGITGPQVTVEDTGPDELREVYETNVLGPVRATRAFLPLLYRHGPQRPQRAADRRGGHRRDRRRGDDRRRRSHRHVLRPDRHRALVTDRPGWCRGVETGPTPAEGVNGATVATPVDG